MAWNLKLRRRTPWQDVTLVNGWTGQVQIRRAGDTVRIRTEGLNGAAATSTAVALLPLGFRPEGPLNERGLLHTVGSSVTVSRWWALSAFNVPATSAPLYGSASWDTTDPMPTGGA